MPKLKLIINTFVAIPSNADARDAIFNRIL